MIRHQFSQVQLTSNEWLRLAASILAASTRSAAVVTPARARRARFGHVQLVELADQAAAAACWCWPTATSCSAAWTAARSSRLRAGDAIGQAELDPAAATLNVELPSLSAPAGAPQARASSRRSPRTSAEVVSQMLEESDGVASRKSSPTASSTCWSSPSSPQGAKLRGVLEVLQRSDFLEQLVPVLTRGGGVHVIIGHENADRRHARGEPRLRAVRHARTARSACWACWARPACRTRARSRPSATCPTLMNELITRALQREP